MNTKELETYLLDTFIEDDEVKSARSFSDMGVLTYNNGLVVRFDNGDEFQITIVQSKYGTDSEEE